MGQSDRDAKALAEQRERDRQFSIADTSALCNYVAQMADSGQLARRRAGGVPIVPGGRLWLAVKLYFDHPDVFADAQRGEYTSITAAARQAGAVTPRRRLTPGPRSREVGTQPVRRREPRGDARRRRRAERAGGAARRPGLTAGAAAA